MRLALSVIIKKEIEFQRQSLSIARETGNKGSEGKAYTMSR